MTSIKVPPLGESIVEATVSRWMKKEGDAVAPGETLVELETDKITVEVPVLKGGVLLKRLKQEGDVVGVDEVLAEVDEGATAATAASSVERSASSGITAAPQAPEAPSVAQTATPSAASAGAAATTATDGAVKSSPGARRVAAESGVDIASVPGTGRGGIVSKPDVVQFVAQQQTQTFPTATAAPAAPQRPPMPSAPSPPPFSQRSPLSRLPDDAGQSADARRSGTRETREKMSTRRKRIAEHLLEAQHQTAHLTTFNEVDMSAVEALRGRLKERIEKAHGVRLSFMPFFVKAACMALRSYPVVNAQIDGDTIVYKNYVNMGIAVASEQGLVVPNIKDADQLGMLDIAREISAVAKRARDGKLTMEDLTGGTFTITNGGVFGSLVSTPIINYPQVGILGLHKIQDRPMAIGGRVEVRPMMYIALSYDHRIIDGQQAVLFLVRVKELIEDPAAMLIE